MLSLLYGKTIQQYGLECQYQIYHDDSYIAQEIYHICGTIAVYSKTLFGSDITNSNLPVYSPHHKKYHIDTLCHKWSANLKSWQRSPHTLTWQHVMGALNKKLKAKYGRGYQECID